MKRIFTLLIAALTVVTACKKDNAPSGGDQNGTNPPGGGTNPPQTSVGIKTDATAYIPGQIAILTVDKTITRDTISVTMAGVKATLTKVNDTQYALVMPVIPKGDYTLNLTAIGVTSNPTVSISTYTPIASPATVISSFKTGLSGAIDTLQMQAATDTAGTHTINVAVLKQLQAQFDKAMQTATDADKQQVAYFIQSNGISFSDLNSQPSFDAAYRVNSFYAPYTMQNTGNKLIMTGLFDDISAKWQSVKQVFVNENQKLAYKIAVLAVGTVVTAVLGAPIAATAIALAGVIYVIKEADKVGSLMVDLYNAAVEGKNIDNSTTTNSTGKQILSINALTTKATTNTIAFTTDKAVWLNATGTFRTIIASDATNPVFADLFTETAKYKDGDNTIKNLLEKLKSGSTSQYGSISTTYNLHNVGVRQSEADKTVALNNSYVTISDVSNADITLSVTDDGTKGLKIMASNPAKNIKDQVSFNFKINYTQSAFNNKVSQTQAATYKPTVDSVALLKAKNWAAYEYFNYDPETKAQSANIIGNTITYKGFYVVCSTANGGIFCSAWNYLILGYSSFSFSFADGFKITSTGSNSGQSIGNDNAAQCVAGIQHIETASSFTNRVVPYNSFRVLNGWLETQASVGSEWLKSYKIVTLNATDLVLEQYVGSTQANVQYSFGNGRYIFSDAKAVTFTTKPGTENALSTRIRFK